MGRGPAGAWDAGGVFAHHPPVPQGENLLFYYAGTSIGQEQQGQFNGGVGLAQLRKLDATNQGTRRAYHLFRQRVRLPRSARWIEPLAEHLEHYEARLANLFGAGVQACYRGPRWYDTDATKGLVKQWIDFFKKHRDILESDVIHVRRPDGRDLDCILHVNPQTKPRGLAMVFNPLDHPVAKTLTLPLYYTGLADTAKIREQEGPAKEYRLDREYHVAVPVEVPAKGNTWLVVE